MAEFSEQTPEDAEESQARMSFGEHLDELRKRILRALYGSLLPIVACMYFYKDIIYLIARPYRLAALAHHFPDQLVPLKPQEAFLTSITLAFQAGLVLASPWIIYQLWQFVAAGLYPRERKIVYRYTAPSAMLFLTGVAFFYFIALPMSLNFFMSFSQHTAGPLPTPNWLERKMGLGIGTVAASSTRPAERVGTAPSTAAAAATQIAVGTGEAASLTTPVGVAGGARAIDLPILDADPPAPEPGHVALYVDSRDGRTKERLGDTIFVFPMNEADAQFTSMWRYDDYLSFVTFTALVFGLAFELPMVIVILAQTGIVETKSFRSMRKYAYFVIVVVAVIVAPSGDPVFLAFLSVPLLALYELGILAADFATRGKNTGSAA